MPQKIINVVGVGEVTLIKRRGAKNLRLSINAAGKVRLSLPNWTPYTVGTAFAQSKADWISQQLSKHTGSTFKDGDLIGKSHRLVYYPKPGNQTTIARIKPTRLEVHSPWPLDDPAVQQKLIQAANRALRQEALTLLPQRLAQIAAKHNFSYQAVKIKKLTSRWGSCSHRGEISLSFYLMQLPWEYIDYVLTHELIHTEHLNHGRGFWDRFIQIMPNARNLQKQIRGFKPHPMPSLE